MSEKNRDKAPPGFYQGLVKSDKDAQHKKEYTVISTTKLEKFIDLMNKLVSEGWHVDGEIAVGKNYVHIVYVQRFFKTIRK